MPIQWFKQPDGTMLLWNTDESNAAPMQVAPQDKQNIPGTDTSDATKHLFEGQLKRQDPGLSDYGFKLKPTAEDRKFVRGAVKDLKSGNLSDQQQDDLAMKLLEQRLYSITDGGDVYGSLRHNPGGAAGTQALLDMFGNFKDRAESQITELGLDPGEMDTQTIINMLRSKPALEKLLGGLGEKAGQLGQGEADGPGTTD